MDDIHYDILKFLSDKKSIPEKDFPNYITSNFKKYVINNGSLYHELNIILCQNKDWIDTELDLYRINENGRKALQIEDDLRIERKLITDLEFTKLKSEVTDLENRLNNFKTDNRRANIAIYISGATLLLTVLIEFLKGCK